MKISRQSAMNEAPAVVQSTRAVTSSVASDVSRVTRSVMHRQQLGHLLVSAISIGLVSFHLVACWLARIQVNRLVQATSRRQRFVARNNSESSPSQFTIEPLSSLDIVYRGFLVSACVVSLLETIRLAYLVHRARVKYEAELDGLSKKSSADLRHQLVHGLTSSNVTLLVRLIADHLPLSAILLAVQLQAPTCGDVNHLLPVSVREPRMTLAAFSIVADSSWRLALLVRQILADYCAGKQFSDRSWYSMLWLTTLKAVTVFGSSATTTLASLSIVIQLMTSPVNVASPSLPRKISERVQLENWIDTSCVRGHVPNISCCSGESSFGQVICLREFINILEDSSYDVISQSVVCPRTVPWDTSKCTTQDVDAIMQHCTVTFNFRVTDLATIEYNYAYRLIDDNLTTVNETCKQSFKESMQLVAMDTTCLPTKSTAPPTDSVTSTSASAFNSTEVRQNHVTMNHVVHNELYLDFTINNSECSYNFMYVASLPCFNNGSYSS